MGAGTVYLAGAMSGLTREEMIGWRLVAENLLNEQGFSVLSPVNTELGSDPMAREITGSNKYQIQHSDIVLAEFDRLDVSKGTVGEVVFAWMIGKPVITWGMANHAEHSWIKDHSVRHFINLTDAVEYIALNYRV